MPTKSSLRLRPACLHALLALAVLLLAPARAIALPRHAPVPGGVAVLPLGPAGASGVGFDGQAQAVVRDGGQWFALVGIPLDTAPGKYEAEVAATAGKRRIAFVVQPKTYPTQRLRIADDKLVTPPPELAARIDEEQARLRELKRHFSPQPAPEADFALPADGRLSARFGGRRILNGEARSPHAGVDLAVGTGQPVRSPAAGRVLAVETLYFTGLTVVVDHGQGLLTLYAHLSRCEVEVGQALRRGERIGASGASGRATGPHLHWGTFLGGTAVDPELFLRPTKR